MSDKPIPFSAPMVRAILDGRKTMTRRVLKSARVFATPEQPAFMLNGAHLERAMQNADKFRHLGGDGWYWEADAFEWQAPSTRTSWMAHIGYAAGQRLWVKEALERANGEAVGYPADGSWLPNTQWHWKRAHLPSRFMPRWASRITLEVTGVRVERLNDINFSDARAEGCEIRMFDLFGADGKRRDEIAQIYFSHLWRDLHGPGAWEANPWVAVIVFRRAQA